MIPKTSKKTTEKEVRTEVVGFKVTPKEKELIERHAEKAGMVVNQYLRATILISMALEGNIDAMKIVFTGVREGFAEALADKLEKMKVQLPEFV